MITELLKTVIGYRIAAMKYFSLACIFEWDMKQRIFKDSKGYFKFNAFMMIICGTGYPIMMSGHLLLKFFDKENGGTGKGAYFGSYICGWVWSCSVAMTVIVAYRLNEYSAQIVYFMNQMFSYAKELQG